MQLAEQLRRGQAYARRSANEQNVFVGKIHAVKLSGKRAMQTLSRVEGLAEILRRLLQLKANRKKALAQNL